MTSSFLIAASFRFGACFRIAALALLLGAIPSFGAGAEARFTAMLEDGTRLSGPDVGPWHFAGAQPKLGGERLFDPANPLRWLRDHHLPLPATPEAFIEFYGGDRFPGEVVRFFQGDESIYDRLPPHFVVTAAVAVDWPDAPRGVVRVAARWLRRIVWRRRASRRHQPGTVFLRDGRELSYRSLRFGSTSVHLLLETGAQQTPYSQIAELHMPRLDPWDCYFEQLAALSPDGRARIMRLETSDGLLATSSTERFAAKAYGSHNPERWRHMVQPPWSLDPLWIKHRTIQFRRYHPPHRVPLSGMEWVDEQPDRTASGHWPWRRDRNVQGDALRSGGQPHGWGLGVHAASRLRFPLPECATGFRTRLGLDASVGRGGCVRAMVYLRRVAGKPAYKSPFIVGSQQVLDTGLISLSPTTGGVARQLILVVDPAHAGRPPGADPLNIRDSLDWLEPEIELDPDQLRVEVRRRAATWLPAWEGWTLHADGAPPIELVNHWDDADAASARYRLQVRTRTPLATLSRRLRVPKDQPWLVLAVSRYAEGTTPGAIQLQLDGKPAGKFNVPVRPSAGVPDPIVASLAQYAGREVRAEILMLPMGPRALLHWRGIALARRPPGVLPLLEDDGLLTGAFADAEGVSKENEHPFSGQSSLKIARGELAILPGDPIRIREHPRLGEFRYLRFAWKKQGGEAICLQLGHDGRFGPDPQTPRPGLESFRYDAGSGLPSYDAAVRVSRKLPVDWVVVTRDLYADFGEFALTGLALSAPDGEHALFDHVHLARTKKDLEELKPAPPKPIE